MIIPDWAIVQLKQIFHLHNGEWKTARMDAKPLWGKLGWKPSVQQIYDAIHDIDPASIVTACGKTKRFDGFWGGYRFCGRSCECSRVQATEKAQVTNLERYGATSVLAVPDIREKSRVTMLDRYGVEHTGQSEELRAKMVATTRERFGVDNAMMSGEVRERLTGTMQERYGVDNASQSSEIVAKRAQTNLERYGSVSPLGNADKRQMGRKTSLERYGDEVAQNSTEVKERTRETLRGRYGVDYLQRSSEMQAKTRKTLQERYGVKSNKHIHMPDALGVLSDKDKLEHVLEGRSSRTVADELGVGHRTVRRYASSHGIPLVEKSNFEAEVGEFIETIVGPDSVVANDRKVLLGSELDFYLPSHRMGIECNGIYWHSSLFKDHRYHRRKYEACRDAGIRLLMINEDEWNHNGDAVRSRLRNILRGSSKGLPARKLRIAKISNGVANDLFDKHHIQGRTGTISYAVGAFDGDELVAGMAFNYQRGTQAVELIRYCTSGASHAGVFSRLFSHARKENQYRRVISFADLRYSEGDVYRNNGFTLDKEIPPDYRYIWKGDTWHKSSFSKRRISERFGLDMTTLTERSAMEELGIPRIYDCGKLRFLWLG